MFGYAIFLRILNMSLTASVIIVFVLACRLLLRRIPKIYSYILWSVVIFRLLCPISISAPISLLGLVQAPVVKLDEDSLWTMQSVQLKDSILDQQVAKEKDFVGGVGFVEYLSSDSGQVEECVYTTDGRSRFIFGQSEENIRKCIAFYSIDRLSENIKVANLRLESAYMNDNIFEKLSNKDRLYWNYFDKKGDIQIGWAYDMDRRTSGSIQRMTARQQHIMMYLLSMELQCLNETVESTEYYIG